MTAIWFILAGMTAAAVLGLLWPMSRRTAVPVGEGGISSVDTETAFYEDQIAEIDRDLDRGLIAPDEAETARAEAARRLLRASRDARRDAEDAGADEAARPAEPRLRRRRAASAFALSTIPLVALIAYGLYGSPELPAQTDADRQAARGGTEDLMKAVGQIEARLARDPNDARGWAVLAPVYMRTGRFDDAARAFANITRLKGETADVLSDWGEALAAAGEGTVTPEAKALFEKAQARDQNAPKPRFYLARAAEQAGDTAEAIRQLSALEAASPADAPWLGLVRQNLARLKGEAAPAAAPAAPPKIPAEQQAAIRGMVDGFDARLKAGGGTPDEWLRLTRSRAVLGERDQAIDALARARVALAGNPQGLAQVEEGARILGLDPTKPAAPAASGSMTGSMAGPAPRSDAESAAAAMQALSPAERDAAIRGMVDGLDRRLAARGGTPDEWLRLVRSYSALGDRDQAIKALDRARMALATNADAVSRLDGLARELDLTAKSNP